MIPRYYTTAIPFNEPLWFIIGFIAGTIFFFIIALIMDKLQKRNITKRLTKVQKAHNKQLNEYTKILNRNKAEGGQQNG